MCDVIAWASNVIILKFVLLYIFCWGSHHYCSGSQLVNIRSPKGSQFFVLGSSIGKKTAISLFTLPSPKQNGKYWLTRIPYTNLTNLRLLMSYWFFFLGNRQSCIWKSNSVGCKYLVLSFCLMLTCNENLLFFSSHFLHTLILVVLCWWQHANIVKFHKFWTDARSETPRVIFITEYMTSGSLKQFLKKTRKSNYKTLNEKVNLKLMYLHVALL